MYTIFMNGGKDSHERGTKCKACPYQKWCPIRYLARRKFLKILRLENLSGEAKLQIVFQGFTILLKNEA